MTEGLEYMKQSAKDIYKTFLQQQADRGVEFAVGPVQHVFECEHQRFVTRCEHGCHPTSSEVMAAHAAEVEKLVAPVRARWTLVWARAFALAEQAAAEQRAQARRKKRVREPAITTSFAPAPYNSTSVNRGGQRLFWHEHGRAVGMSA